MEAALVLDLATSTMMNSPQFMDEVAVCFADEPSLLEFVEEAKTLGLEHFNSVPYDTMNRQDVPGEKFGVRFEFLRMEFRPWRIEAMCVMDGMAPLHHMANTRFGSPCVVHVSYKLPNLQAYQDEVRKAMDQGHRKVAEYANSYGMFSYWKPAGHMSTLPFWKPRVNLRDVQESS